MVIALDFKIFIHSEAKIQTKKNRKKNRKHTKYIHTLLCKLAEKCKNKKGIYILKNQQTISYNRRVNSYNNNT